MKIGVIKLGARITWKTDAAVGPGEAISICKALVSGGAEVHVYTKIIKNDELNPTIIWHNILEDQETNNLDALLIINGNVNFFGGAEDRAQILNYKLINHFKGTVAYVMCDPELQLMQIWDNVSKKSWGQSYKETDVLVTRKDIVLLSQPTDLEKIKARCEKKNMVHIDRIFHFPFERFPLLNEWLPAKQLPEIDLMYGGTTRNGRRVPNLFKWYFGLPMHLSVEIFGKIDLDDFIKHPKVGHDSMMEIGGICPRFTGMVKYCDVLSKMNSSLAHLVTGDPSYEELNIVPQRTYECLAAGNVIFVDAAMDTNRRIWPAGTLEHDFLYVKSRQELADKLIMLKHDDILRDELLAGQLKATNFNAQEFCESLVKQVMEL